MNRVTLITNRYVITRIGNQSKLLLFRIFLSYFFFFILLIVYFKILLESVFPNTKQYHYTPAEGSLWSLNGAISRHLFYYSRITDSVNTDLFLCSF